MDRVSFEIDGQRYEFDRSSLKRLGAGGEGIVFLATAGDDRYALKIYHKITVEKIEKIRAAIAVRPASATYHTATGSIVQLAWPQALLLNERKEPIGLVMPYIDLTTALPFLYFTDPVLATSKKHKEPLSLVLKSKIARNLCSLVKSLHDIGHHFIDFKPQNALVYGDSGQVCLVDCDSYSIKGRSRRFPANAYSAEYINPIALVNEIPPEKLGEDQDNWAVAVALFKLFNLGTHPYSGIISASINPETIDENVKMGLYAYGRASHPLISPRRMSAHHLFPDEMRSMFDRAFSHASSAPKMEEWVRYFDSLIVEKAFKRCDKYPNDLEHIRFDGIECIACHLSEVKAKFSPAPSKMTTGRSSFPSPGGLGSTASRPSGTRPPNYISPSSNKKPSLWLLWMACGLFALWFLNQIPGPTSNKQPSPIVTYPSPNDGPTINTQKPTTNLDPIHQTLAKQNLFNRYAVICSLQEGMEGFYSYKFHAEANSEITFIVQTGSSAPQYYLMSNLSFNDETNILSGDLLEEDRTIEAEIAFRVFPSQIQMYRLVDLAEEKAIVLNGFSLKSDQKMPELNVCY